MPKISINFSLPLIVLLLLPILAACSSSADENLAVSTLNRPVAIAIAVLEWNPSEADKKLYEEFEGLWEQCLGIDRRPFAFVVNSGGNSVARIDLCTSEVKNSNIKTNPFVVSHIPVGKLPSDVEVSLDSFNSRVFVTNAGEKSLSIIDSRQARPLPYRVQLPSQPSFLTVVPSNVNDLGDIYISLPKAGQVVRVRKEEGDEGLWAADLVVDLKSAGVSSPLPGALAAHPDGQSVYVTDMEADVFYTIDVSNPLNPPVLRNVYGPQRSCKVSDDGRFLYLTKLDKRRIAVYDLVKDRYVDTNEELPSHRNISAPSEQFDYDIELLSIPRAVVFADIPKELSVAVEDGDEDESDGDIDAEEDVENEETGEDEVEQEDGDGDESSEEVSEEPPENEELRSRIFSETQDIDKSLYAYSIGYNGIIQVLDVHNNLHELFDTDPENPPSLQLIGQSELDIDIGMCLADIDYRVYDSQTKDAVWELHYNGVISKTDLSVSGQFDFENNRLYDPNVDFSLFSEIQPRLSSEDPEDPYSLKGDFLVIRTPVAAITEENSGCVEEIIGEDGEPVLIQLDVARMEITDVTPDYIEFDPRGIKLEDCYESAVEYFVRANGNYLLYRTELDSKGNRIGNREYLGRAGNVEFVRGDRISSEEQFQALRFERDDWSDFVCLIETPQEDGTTIKEYRFREDLGISGTGDVLNGMFCRNPWDDIGEHILSFENDEISFSICQDTSSEDIINKQLSTFIYSFRTYSGTNEILSISEDIIVDGTVGTVLEDAALLDLYPDFPRLYVVDSVEEIVYVIDVRTDTLTEIIL